MNKKRLLRLADLLEADAKNKKGVKFDLGTWGRSTDEDVPAIVSCGTTACAMGLAAISGRFKRAGLFNKYGDGSWSILPAMKSGALGLDAAVELFDIRTRDAEFLFLENEYPRGKTEGAIGERFVAKRIRKFVADKAISVDA